MKRDEDASDKKDKGNEEDGEKEDLNSGLSWMEKMIPSPSPGASPGAVAVGSGPRFKDQVTGRDEPAASAQQQTARTDGTKMPSPGAVLAMGSGPRFKDQVYDQESDSPAPVPGAVAVQPTQNPAANQQQLPLFKDQVRSRSDAESADAPGAVASDPAQNPTRNQHEFPSFKDQVRPREGARDAAAVVLPSAGQNPATTGAVAAAAAAMLPSYKDQVRNAAPRDDAGDARAVAAQKMADFEQGLKLSPPEPVAPHYKDQVRAATLRQSIAKTDLVETLTLTRTEEGIAASSGRSSEEERAVVGFNRVQNDARGPVAGSMEHLVLAQLVEGDEIDEEERERIYQRGLTDAEDRLRLQAVDGEIVDEDAKARRVRRKRMKWIGATLLVIIAVAVGTGVGVGRRNSSPIIVGQPSVPTISPMPSMAPTPAPDNDFCEDSVALSAESGVVSSFTLANATSDTVASCTDGVDTTTVAAGRWFSYVGRGAAITSYVVCIPEEPDFEQVYIFTGDCDALECVSSSDGYASVGTAGTCKFWSENSWEAASGTLYRILVTGSGLLSLSIDDNDSCEDAIGPLLPDGSPTYGRGWYSLVGTGGTLSASLACVSGSSPWKLVVSKGQCGSLERVDEETNPCALGGAVSWQSETGELYYIFIEAGSRSPGSFFLRIENSVVNDRCEDAIGPLDSGVSVQGSTINATVDNVGDCDVQNEGPGVWYTATGTGSRLTVSTCGNADFDTRISVFAGQCGGLKCVGGNDDACGDQSAFTWLSKVNMTYFILVHGGAEDGSGNFNIAIEEFNEFCDKAFGPLPTDGSLVVGSNTGSTFEAEDLCLPAEEISVAEGSAAFNVTSRHLNQ